MNGEPVVGPIARPQVRRWATRRPPAPRVSRAILRQVRDMLKAAVAHDNAPLALEAAKLHRQYDLLVAAPPPPVDYLREITLEHPGMCQTCLQEMLIGETALWQESVGVWHPRCLGRTPSLPLPLEEA